MIDLTTDQKIIYYDKFITNLANEKSDFTFHNEGAQHASIVFANMFRTASNIIRIYSKALNTKVSDHPEYLSQLKSFLDNNGTIKIILEQSIDPSNPVLSILNSADSKKIQILSNNGIVFKNADGKPIHFATGDSRMYRIEVEPTAHKAIGSFNDVQTTSEIENLFDVKFEKLQNGYAN